MANAFANGDKCISFSAVYCPKMCKCWLLHMAPHSFMTMFVQKEWIWCEKCMQNVQAEFSLLRPFHTEGIRDCGKPLAVSRKANAERGVKSYGLVFNVHTQSDEHLISFP